MLTATAKLVAAATSAGAAHRVERIDERYLAQRYCRSARRPTGGRPESIDLRNVPAMATDTPEPPVLSGESSEFGALGKALCGGGSES
jgi:hypothetical protein